MSDVNSIPSLNSNSPSAIFLHEALDIECESTKNKDIYEVDERVNVNVNVSESVEVGELISPGSENLSAITAMKKKVMKI